MNKIMTSVGALAVALTLSAAPAKAGNDAALVIGGILGGIVLNEALSGPRYYAPPPRVYYAPPRPGYYYEEDYYYAPRCRTVTRQVWDRYSHQWVLQQREVCR